MELCILGYKKMLWLLLNSTCMNSIEENLKDSAEKVQYFTKNYKIQEATDRETKNPLYTIFKN